MQESVNLTPFQHQGGFGEGGAVGGQFKYVHFRGSEGLVYNASETFDLSYIVFENEQTESFIYDSDQSELWFENDRASLTEFNILMEEIRSENYKSGEYIQILGSSTNGLNCVKDQIEKITGHEVINDARFISIDRNRSVKQVWLSDRVEQYNVTFNYASLVIDISTKEP